MRRKVKQLLATGMALAVLATNLMPVSLAAETAEELQTGEAATQALTDEVAVQALEHYHIYTQKESGFDVIDTETGEARPYVVLGCINGIGSCNQKEITYYGKNVSPSSTTNATCTRDKVFHYSGTWITSQGNGFWRVEGDDITVPNSKANHKFTNYVGNTGATCTKDATEIASCDYGCGKTDIRDIKGTKLGHDFTKKDAAHVTFAFAEDGKTAVATIRCDRCNATTTETVPCTAEVTTPATCTKMGTTTYTATCGTASETTTRQDVAMADHEYSATVEWVGTDFMKGRVTYECTQCYPGDKGHFKYEDVDAVVKVVKEPTCLKDGEERHFISASINGVEVAQKMETVKLPALGHDFTKKDAAHVTFAFAEDGKTAVATIRCDRCGVTTTENVVCTAEVTTPATCTEKGTTTYTATCGTASETTTRQDVPALGHSFTNYVYNGDATCGGDGTETAKCDRCDVTDTRTAVATAGCDLHTVDGAKVCAVCGKVNGQPKLAAAEANADVNASTIGVHLVVRVGTLPTGQKVITVAFLNNDGQAVQMFGTQKIHVSLAQLKAALGDTEGTGFEHTLTRVNTANGEKQNVGFTVENGTVNFDAAFNGSTACILLVD